MTARLTLSTDPKTIAKCIIRQLSNAGSALDPRSFLNVLGDVATWAEQEIHALGLGIDHRSPVTAKPVAGPAPW